MMHLIIPDGHASPGFSNERFDYVGKLILDRRPTTVVCIGDLFDMASLSSYDRGKKDFQGRTYLKDIESGLDALHRIDGPLNSYNAQRKKNGKAQYKPRKVFCIGNHEERIERAINLQPELDGVVGYADFQLGENGWEVQPFLIPLQIDGVFYNHYFITGVSGEPISGLNPAASIVAKQMESCISGHTHVWDCAIRNSPSGRMVISVVVGCLVDYPMKYATATQHLWWSGVTILNNVHDGEFDIEQISLSRLKEMYG